MRSIPHATLRPRIIIKRPLALNLEFNIDKAPDNTDNTLLLNTQRPMSMTFICYQALAALQRLAS